jgi:arylsulfatase A-like enzyme
MLSLAAAACAPDRRPPNIVLVSIDTLRADHLGCYGYERPTSPALDALAEQGVLFEAAFSTTSWTLPAHAAMFTGLPDSVHGCGTGVGGVLAPARSTLAEALREAGYATAGFWAGPYLAPEFGLDQGFDDWIACAAYALDDGAEAGRPRPSPQAGRLTTVEKARSARADVTGPRILESVRRWLDGNRQRPFFLFVHLWDVHHDYLPPAPYDEMFDAGYEGDVDGRYLSTRPFASGRTLSGRDLVHLVSLYDGEVAWTDEHVRRLLELVGEHSPPDETVVVVTADHGEEFLEHGGLMHHRTLHDESIRVPLIVRAPGARAGLRVDEVISLVDVAPTLLELAGARPLPDTLGRSLAARLHGGPPMQARPAVAELSFQDDVPMLAVRTRDWKILADASSGEPLALWDLRADPGELDDVLGRDDELARTAGRALESTRDGLEQLRALHGPVEPGEARVSERTLGQLQALGYVEGTTPARQGALAQGPAPIAWGTQPCDSCGSPIRAPGFAARAVAVDGRLFAFDDPGCLLTELAAGRLQPARVVFHHADEDRWLALEQAGFVRRHGAPAGFGYAAVDAKGAELDFAGLRAELAGRLRSGQ